MKIKLDEEYFIEDSGSGFSLIKWKGQVDKKGYPLYDLQKCPANLEQALRLYARFKAMDTKEEMTLSEYVESINSSYNRLSRAIRGEQ